MTVKVILLYFLLFLVSCNKSSDENNQPPSDNEELPSDNEDLDNDEEDYYTLRVFTYNIYHGSTNKRDGVINLDVYSEIINSVSPDIVALQELGKNTKRNGFIDVTAELSQMTGLEGHFIKSQNFDGGEFGSAILSKFPVEHIDIFPGYGSGVLNFAKIQIDSGVYIYLNNIHLPLEANYRKSQTRQIIDYYKNKISKAPTIICGDFNAEPDSEEMDVLWEEFSPVDESLSYTFSVRTGLVKKIDYILYPTNKNWEVVEFKRVCRIDASDHCGILAVFRFKK